MEAVTNSNGVTEAIERLQGPNGTGVSSANQVEPFVRLSMLAHKITPADMEKLRAISGFRPFYELLHQQVRERVIHVCSS